MRATKLESFRTCPFRYHNEPKLDGDAEHFRFGSALHKYIELLLVNLINGTTEQMILSERWVKQRLMIIKMWNMFKELVDKKWYKLVVSEWTNKQYFEDINVSLEWTFDHLFTNPEWEYVLVDAKTAASKRTEEHKLWARQNVIYPALMKYKYGIDIRFFWVLGYDKNK